MRHKKIIAMVYKSNVMIGDIIRLKKWAFEVLEVGKSAVTGRLLKLGYGEFNAAWSETQPYELTDGLMECLGFAKDNANDHLWEKISDGMKISYDTRDHGLSILGVGEGGNKRGFCFIYIYTLHELMHLCKDYGVETCKFYKQILDYNPPILNK